MNKQHSSEMQSIRKKLVAAIAMLLVAVIMTVSSTYAWFTLSTAPEVKGITTTVGANGNLEIALGTYDTVYGTTPVASYEGSSLDVDGADVKASNITWGNLVDLTNGYGVGNVRLYPTRLNVENGIFNMLSPLQYAIYGTDGRVAELSSDTMLGGYDVAKGFISNTNITSAGFSAVGSVSGMSPRKFAIRNHKSYINSYRLAAQGEAKGAISLYAGDLAALAIDYQGVTGDPEVAADKIEILQSLIVKLEAANANIGNSLKSAALLSMTSMESLSESAWEIAMATAETMDINQIIAALGSGDIEGDESAVITLPTQVTDVVDKHNAIATTLNTAKTTLTNAGSDSKYLWSEVKDVVGDLLNKTGILICGQTIEAVAADKSNPVDGGPVDQLTEAVMNGGLVFTFGKESGIFADIAEMTGEYSSTIKFPDGYRVEGINISKNAWPVDVEAEEVKTMAGVVVPGWLGFVYDFLADEDYTAEDNNPEQALTDTYGYTVDMLFRTNAADSFLQLQTDAANRIYDNNSNTALMGGGSNMSFTVSPEYNAEKINGLASGIRVVFYETSTTQPNILCVATLDTDNAVTTGTQHKLNLKLADYTIDDSNGKITINGLKADNEETAQDDSVAICSLAANTPKKITALVYLDGDAIDNSDAGLIENLNGVLNLQFSSSAVLTPMVNNTLMNTVVE